MRLLLVEDDLELIKSLNKPLKDAGYVVDVASDGIEGEYLGNENIYDIAILDLGLPKRNGLEVLSNWRKANNKLPVIVLTARDTWQERVVLRILQLDALDVSARSISRLRRSELCTKKLWKYSLMTSPRYPQAITKSLYP